MKNKITKFLTILSIIFISFFIKSKNTYAFECVWNLKPTYIDFNYENGTTKVNRIVNSYDINGHNSLYILVYDSNRVGSNFVLKRKFISSNKIDVIDKFSSTDFDSAALVNWASNESCPNYVKIYKGKGLSGMEAKISNSDEFVKYLKNQYDTYSPLNGEDLYGNIEHKSMVFTNVGSTYPTKHLNEMVNDRGTSIEKIKALQVDTGKSGMDKLYYESTKTAWYMYANSRIDKIDYANYANYDNECTEIEISKFGTISACVQDDIGTFKIWFDTVSRWIFEEDYSSFKKYYRYANTGTLTQTQIDNNLNLFDADTGLTENKSEKDTLLKDKCLALCPRNATALTNCQSGSTYQKCKSATDACKNISSDSAYQTCLKGRMGEADYNSFINSYNSRMEELEKEESEYRQTIKDALSRVSAPTLDVDFEPYEVTCDDVAIFHTFYVILEIMAPILVILFGTIDYAKAVIASDVEKMQKVKKNFPKRLGLLLLFIFVPLIVSFLIGEFSSTNSSLMYCIINGG